MIIFRNLSEQNITLDLATKGKHSALSEERKPSLSADVL